MLSPKAEKTYPLPKCKDLPLHSSYILTPHLGGLLERLDGLVLLLELGPVQVQVVHALRRPELRMRMRAADAPLRIMILEMALEEEKKGRERH